MLSTWPDWLRVINLVLSTISLVHLVVFRAKNAPLRGHQRDQWWIWTVVSASVVYLSLDGILRHTPVTFRSLFVTLIALALAQGIYVRDLWPLHEDEAHDEKLF